MSKTKVETRTKEQLREHYEIEKELAGKLRKANKEERKHLYTTLYDEYFRRVPQNPQAIRKVDPVTRRQSILPTANILKSLLNSESTYLEIGPGDCALAFEVSKFVKKVYAIDVSRDITKNTKYPENFELIISDGTSINVPGNSVNLAYSNQLMEHLHPEDALEQLNNIYQSLMPGGKYICVTPNRLFGPHDISKYFDNIATGFHMKEYTISELATIFKVAKFSKVERFIAIKGHLVILPLYPANVIENTLLKAPRSIKRVLQQSKIANLLLGGSNVKLIATKSVAY